MTFRLTSIAAASWLIALVGCASSSPVRDHPLTKDAIKASDADSLAIRKVKPKSATPLKVASPAFEAGGEIPYKYSDFGEKISPELTLGDIPAGAVSLVLLMEDPDAPLKPFIHWVLFNVPADRTHLREAMPGDMRLRDLGDANQGLNSRGSVGYFGPHPPYEHPAHHYHFQVFALDQKLDLPPGATRDAVLKAIDRHVLAAGELIGTYKAAK